MSTPQPVVAKPTGCEQWLPLIEKYGWDKRVAKAVMEAESHCKPDINNAGLNYDGSVDYGLMQINSIHKDMVGDLSKLYNPEVNLAVAYSIYTAHGWTAWSTYNNGAYQKYLN